MKNFLITVACLLLSGMVSAQQEIMISQYMFNGLVLNPAYAGSHSFWQATALHRSQWVGFEKAPVTQTLCLDGPLAGRKLGAGLTVSNDQLGVTRQFEIGANFAAHLQTGPGTISLGLRAAVASYSAKLSDVVVWDEGDPLYAADLQGEMVPKIGLGAYFYNQHFYAGLSVPVVFAGDKNILSENSSVDKFFQSHFYLNSGYVFEPTPAIAVKPSILIKYQQAAPLEVDINCNVLFFQKFWAGLGYRTGDALVAMAEWNISNQFRVGYSYDYTLTDIADYSSGSHEIMLGFDFGKEVNVKTRSPRYF